MFSNKLNFRALQSGSIQWGWRESENSQMPPIGVEQKVPFTNRKTKAQREVTQNQEGARFLSLLSYPSPSLTSGATEANSPSAASDSLPFCALWSSSLQSAARPPCSLYHIIAAPPTDPKQQNQSFDIFLRSSYLGPAGSQFPLLSPMAHGTVPCSLGRDLTPLTPIPS